VPFQPELPGANDTMPAGTLNTPSVTIASIWVPPIRTRTVLPTPAGGSCQLVLRLPYPSV
jgi:hypothetical protein